MVSATRTAVTGLKAASRTVDAAAGNIANARTTSSSSDVEIQALQSSRRSGGQPDAEYYEGYRPVRMSQESREGGGVRAKYGTIDPSHFLAFGLGDPRADDDGMVAYPNVDIVNELLTIGQARRAYEASLKVIATEDKMAGSLLDAPT